MLGEIRYVAEHEQNVLSIPVVLEVAEVEVEVTVRVGIHVRHAVVPVGEPCCSVQCAIRATRSSACRFLYFMRSLKARERTEPTLGFFHTRRPHLQDRVRQAPHQNLIRGFKDTKLVAACSL